MNSKFQFKYCENHSSNPVNNFIPCTSASYFEYQRLNGQRAIKVLKKIKVALRKCIAVT